jgi:hypothetical protein
MNLAEIIEQFDQAVKASKAKPITREDRMVE